MLKLKMIHFLSGVIAYEVGKFYDFEDEEAVRLVNAGIAKPNNKKAFDEVVVRLEEKRIEQEEKEKKASAILYAEELDTERAKLQARVDEITDAKGDAASYYKTYIDLAADLAKKGESNGKDSNENQKDGLSQGGDE